MLIVVVVVVIVIIVVVVRGVTSLSPAGVDCCRRCRHRRRRRPWGDLTLARRGTIAAHARALTPAIRISPHHGRLPAALGLLPAPPSRTTNDPTTTLPSPAAPTVIIYRCSLRGSTTSSTAYRLSSGSVAIVGNRTSSGARSRDWVWPQSFSRNRRDSAVHDA